MSTDRDQENLAWIRQQLEDDNQLNDHAVNFLVRQVCLPHPDVLVVDSLVSSTIGERGYVSLRKRAVKVGNC